MNQKARELISTGKPSIIIHESRQKFGLLHTDQAQYGLIFGVCSPLCYKKESLKAIEEKGLLDFISHIDMRVGAFLSVQCSDILEDIKLQHFKNGENLLSELEYLVENDVIKSGEYQLPDALRRLTEKGCLFRPGKVNEWLDCGNKEVTVQTNKHVLIHDYKKHPNPTRINFSNKNSIVIEPCFIGEDVVIENSVVGPYASIGKNAVLSNCRISDSIIQDNCRMNNMIINNSMIGSNTVLNKEASIVSLGDFSTINE